MTPGLRNLVEETSLSPANLIYPMFVCEGSGVRREIPSMPGVFNFSVDELVRDVETFAGKGLGGIMLFGIPDSKDDKGTSGCTHYGIVQRAVRELKKRFPHLMIVTDVCLCEYTSHGHCGIVSPEGIILNDETIEVLGQMAVSHAEAGADMVAPSDMMDLRVGYIRSSLDVVGFTALPIMSYAVKYASAFYGPFRDAAQSTPSSGDRKSHQLNPANSREGLREAEADLAEGADILMVKPASHYLDMVRMLRDGFDVPIAAYQVSGEYSMIKAAAANGWIDEQRATWESLVSIKRAGADIILSYFARDVALGNILRT
jgi:porphobilinogen synthase